MHKIVVAGVLLAAGIQLDGINNFLPGDWDEDGKKPTSLTVENIRQPKFVKIIDSKPEFGWILPTDAMLQKGYQILVASTNELINQDIGNIWDSGEIRSSQSTNIEFGGQALKENTRYFWKVRFYDVNNELSAYSEYQEFTTGNFGEKSTSQNFFQIEKIKPVATRKNIDASHFIDFGRDAFATLHFNYEPQKKETITIRVGEKLLDGKIDREPGGTIRYQEVELQVTPNKSYYKIDFIADERNTNSKAIALPDSFPVLIPFRYAEIVGVGDNFDPEQTIQVAYFNYFDYSTSSFTSSDSILNQVWDICKYSMKATTFAGYYVDGERERIPYEADAYLNQLSHYCVDNEYAIARKTIEYFFVSKPTWPTEWQLHVALMMYQDYQYTGNTELIEKYYERLKAKTLMTLEVEDGFISIQSPKHNNDFLLSLGFPDTTTRLRDIVDWPPESNNFGGINRYQKGERDGYVFKRINTVVNGFYYHNMKIMAHFATILDKPAETLDFEFRAARVKKSINDQLFDEEKGYYVDGVGTDHGSLHANMILMAFDVVPESRKKTVIEHVKSRGMACSVYGAQYLMEALYKAGEDNYAHELMSATHDRSWYNMIKIGATITLEAWDMKYKVNADWNHAWGAAPANIIPRYMWGIQPKTAGFGIVKIEPKMGTLKHSSISYPTILGQIKGDFRKVGNHQTNFKIELPANMLGEFIFDWSSQDTLILNSEYIKVPFEPVRLYPGVNTVSIRKSISSPKINPPVGRVAIVADGNSPDPDDLGGTAVSIALLRAAGLEGRLVHYSHSCDLVRGSRISEKAEKERHALMQSSCDVTARRWGGFESLIFYDAMWQKEETVKDLSNAINASAADDPLWIVEAGEPDIIGLALDATPKEKHKHIKVLTHHPANDNAGDFYTWQQILDFGVEEVRIPDQNMNLKVDIGEWDWAMKYPDSRIQQIWLQGKIAEVDNVVQFQKGKWDCSDAGMILYWITGATNGGLKRGTVTDVKSLLLDFVTSNPEK